jgi:glycosyltransferase involved in cell wall biosynthesis
MVRRPAAGSLMERRVRPAIAAPGTVTSEAAAGLRALEAYEPEPLVLGVYPTMPTNPFQVLLYQRAREHGLATVALRKPWQIGELATLQRSGLGTVLHLHWLHPILADARSGADAARSVGDAIDQLDAYRSAGGRIAWTVHNVLPHETRFQDDEVRLAAAVAARADVVHIMSDRTPELVAPYYELPRDRLLAVPHMSYFGAYPDHVSRLDARHALGLLPDDLVLLTLGWIRPYKGLDDLLDAWQSLPPATRRLVVAGEPTQDAANAAFLERAALDPTVVLDARSIPAEEIQVFLRAADVAVLPYRRSLNSGALLLALTFGLPAIVPRDSGLADLIGPAFGRAYDAAPPADLADALAGAPALATGEARAAAEAAARAVHPAEISRRFAVGLRERLAGSG